MYHQLYQYFIQHKELNVPGIGTFLLERKPAQVDFAGRRSLPPSYAISLRHPAVSPPTYFFSWLANVLNINDREAVIRFNDFVFDLKKQIIEGDTITWNGMGTLGKGLAGEIKFTAEKLTTQVLQPVVADRVTREKAEHMVRVGEDEKTSVEMEQWLHPAATKKDYWWAYALTLGLFLLIFIGWYFSEHGLSPAATANHHRLAPLQTTTTYHSLR